MAKPNLFISGFAKSGTTVLYHYFTGHPDVFCNPYIKEPRYFSSGHFKSSNGNKHFFKNIKYNEIDYLKLFKNSGDEKYIVDGSVYNSYFKGIAPKIREFNEKARIILCIRNPISRFNSHYMMHIRDNACKGSVTDFINNPETYFGISLLKAGLYSEAIKEYFDVFGRDKVYIAVYDDLQSDHEKYYSDICEFLGISDVKSKNERINISGRPRNPLVMMTIRWIKRLIPGFLTAKMKFDFKTKINSYLYNDSTLKKENLPEDAKAHLVDYYKEDIIKTGKLINRDLSHWIY